MTDPITVNVWAKSINEDGPPAVVISLVQGSFQYVGFHTPEDARRIAAGMVAAADEVELNAAVSQPPTGMSAAEFMAAGEAEAAHDDTGIPEGEKVRCVYCGADDNYRCCEYGRDK